MRDARPLLALAAALGAGCSVLAKRTPTPAARIDEAELARLPHVAADRYYLLLFGSHDPTRRPKYTHTWATLVRATGTPDCAEPALEIHTISWLPTKLDIDALSFRVEPGANVELHDTLRHVLNTGQEVALWGPYEVWHGLAYRFLTQKGFLDGGAVGYQCIDTVGEAARLGNGCDCIHAIADMDPVYPRWRYPLALYGQPATANLVRRLMHSPIFIDPPRTHDWLIPRLGLDRYPIDRREYHGRSVPHVPGAPGLQVVVPPAPLPARPVPKVDTPSAPGTPAKKDPPAAPAKKP
jgi:hypothetical protein